VPYSSPVQAFSSSLLVGIIISFSIAGRDDSAEHWRRLALKMSGVEVAGFVLAAIPLVISFVEHYADGLRTVNRWRKYDRELKSVCRRLRSEEELFRNTCELLLHDIVSSEQEMECLISDPLGKEWANKDLEQNLRSKLSPGSYAVYMEVVEDMKDAMTAFKDRLGMKEDGKVSGRPKNNKFQLELEPDFIPD
jgi:hypothetical protein